MAQQESNSASLEERFDNALTKSVEETISEVLGKNVSDAFGYHLYAYLGLSSADIPTHLNEFFTALIGSFGVGGKVLGGRMIRKLYAKLDLTLTESNSSLSDFSLEYTNRVQEARKRFLNHGS